MPRITYKMRTGKDFFKYLKMSLVDTNTANNWAMAEFVKIDEKDLSFEDLSRLNSRAYLTISGKIFPMTEESEEIIESGDFFIFEDLRIRKKEIHRDFITRIQTEISNKKNVNYIELLKTCITKFFDINIEDLDTKPYYLAAFLVNKVNFFLTELTKPSDNYELDDIWINDSRETTESELVDVVRNQHKNSKENAEAEYKGFALGK